MATFKKRIEYIASTNEHPARFTIKDVSYTNETGDVYEFEYENNFYSPFSSVYEGKADVRGWFYSLRSSGELQVGAGTTQDAGFVTQANTWYKLKISTEAGGNVKLYINGNQVAHNTGGTVATVTIIPIMWGKGNNEFNVPHKKKSFKMWKNGTLLYDYIPVLDNNDVPCWFNRVDSSLLYADAGYTPTIVGGTIEYECGDGLRERQLLIANKTILPYYCELEYISYPTQFLYAINSDIGATATSVIEIETEIKYLGSLGGGVQLEGNGSAGRWYGINAEGNYTLGGGVISTTPASTTTFDKIRDIQDCNNATNTLYVNGVQLLQRTSMNTGFPITMAMFTDGSGANYQFNVAKKYHKVWVDGKLVYDWIPVLDYNRVPCWYNRVNGNFLYAYSGNTPTVWGREIHPIERIHCNKNYYYNIVNFLNFEDTLGCKVFIESDSGGNASNVFLGSDGVNTAFTITYNQNNNLVYRWFSTTYQYAVGLGQHYRVDEIEFNKNHIVVNGIEETNVTSDVTTLANCRLFGANSISSMLGWLYNCWVKDPFGAYKMYLIPFVDETGTAGLFDTVTRTILEKYASGVPTYDDILLESIENKVITDGDTGGPYISLPYEANNNTHIKCRFKIKDVSYGRYMYGNTQYRMSHSSSTFSVTYGPGYYKSITTNPVNVIRVERNVTRNYFNEVEVESNDERNPFTTTSFSIFTQGSSNNGMVGPYNYFQIDEGGPMLYDLVPTLRNGVIGMVNTVDGVLYPNLRAGVDFFPNFLPQLRKFDPYDKIDYFSITIDTRKIVNNKTYDFVNGTPTNTNYIVDWGDGQIEQAGTTHTYAEAGEYEIRFIPTDVGNFPWLRFSTGQSTTPSCLISVNNRYPKMASTVYDVPNWFTGCTNLVSICEDFLQNNRHITNLASIFYTCAKLPAIGKNFFKGMTKLRALSYGFNGTALAEIPAGLLDDCTDLRVIERMFSSTPITSIPAGLFDNINKAGVTSLVILFSSTNIKSVPAGLFDGFINVTNVTQIFNECSELETIPDLLFNDLRKVTNFRYCFYNDAKLTIPANLFCNEATDMATRFTDVASVDFTGTFSRLTWTGTTAGTAPQLWNYTMPNSVTPGNCYSGAGNNATSLTNYASIPQAWGGTA